MRFSTIFTAAMAFGYVAAQATTAQQIVQTFKEITTLSDNLRIQTQKINIVNAPLEGFKVAQGFTEIISRVNRASTMLSGGASRKTKRQIRPLDDSDAQLVVRALTTFVQVHQALLNVVIEKHGILTLVPFFGRIRQSLVSLEAAIDTFAFYLIALIPTQTSAAKNRFGGLTVTVEQAKDTYSGIL